MLYYIDLSLSHVSIYFVHSTWDKYFTTKIIWFWISFGRLREADLQMLDCFSLFFASLGCHIYMVDWEVHCSLQLERINVKYFSYFPKHFHTKIHNWHKLPVHGYIVYTCRSYIESYSSKMLTCWLIAMALSTRFQKH